MYLFHYLSEGSQEQDVCLSRYRGQVQQKEALVALVAATKLVDHVREPRIPLVST